MNKANFLILAGIAAFAVACTKQPFSDFDADKTETLQGTAITFTSRASNAERIIWNFGDGKTGEGDIVSNVYTKAGSYLVTSTAFSKRDSKWDKSQLVVNITAPPVVPTPPPPPPPKNRYLTKLVLKKFAAKKLDNSSWDSASTGTPEPDIYVLLKLASPANWQTQTGVRSNAKDSADWDLTPQNLLLSNQNWEIEMRDEDNTTVFGVVIPASETMQTLTVNPATAPITGKMIPVVSGAYEVNIYFDER